MAEKILFGLMGENLDHSASPLIFNRYFQLLNLNCFYHTYPVSPESLADLLAKIRTSAVAGLNVTIPYKENIIPHLDEIDQKAEEIGAVNVVHNVEGKLKGYNTDYAGFTRALLHHSLPDIKSAVVLGAGGASRSVIYSLYKLKAREIIFFSRSQRKMERILDHFSFISHVQGYPWKDSRIKEKTKQADLIINATPVGMYPFEDDSPLDLDFPVKKNLIAFDLIYNPQKTKFLEEARKKGIAIENGSRMLIYQAVESYKIWKNTQINEDFFIKSSEEVLHASLFKRR